MSKKLYIDIYAASFGFALLTIFVTVALHAFGSIQKSDRAVAPAITWAEGFGLLAFLQFAVVHIVCNFLLLAQMWRAIQDGQTAVTAQRAIGLLFVPFFNVYWIFRAWGSFPTEYNRYVERYDLPVPPLAGNIFVAYPILILLAAVLYVPLLAVPFVFLAVVSKTGSAINALDQAVRTRRDELTASRPPWRETVIGGDLKIKLQK